MNDEHTADYDAHPADNGTTVNGLSERSAILCRTCMRPLTWETRTEPGFNPRTGFYDDARSDPLICFKAVSYRHEPLTDREWAYYEAGQGALRFRVETACDGYSALWESDVPGDVFSAEDYLRGAHDAAEAIRGVISPGTSEL